MIKSFFKQISEIPRASYQEKRISDYLVAFAQERKLKVRQDEKLNVVIFKDATPGYESHPVVLLQSHIDMVAEKNMDSDHDFDNDPIELIEHEDGWLSANKTTLGADDGAGVAYMLAILDDTTLKHPSLECVFTVEEEVGMGGVLALDTSDLKATRMIGLDSSGENSLTISSSGGNRGVLSYKFKYERTYKHQIIVQVRGLKGGHSGVEIDQGRANAAKLAGGVLQNVLKKYDVGFTSMHGGLKDNAIMRECDLVLGVREEEVTGIIEVIEQLEKKYQKVYIETEEGLRFDVVSDVKDCYTTSIDTSKEIAKLVTLLPFGYFQKSPALNDLVISSMNIGRVETSEDEISIGLSMRSPNAFTLSQINDQVAIIADLCNASISFTDGYPGWEYNPVSPLREIMNEAYQELHNGESMLFEATHGGLELGVFKDKLKDLDIVAIGPIMEDIHTPDERLFMPSFERVYNHLVATLAKL